MYVNFTQKLFSTEFFLNALRAVKNDFIINSLMFSRSLAPVVLNSQEAWKYSLNSL